MPKFWHFELKSINLLILKEFCIYPMWNVLISNLTLIFEKYEAQSPNMGILEQKVSAF